jgi:hypothetical protein
VDVFGRILKRSVRGLDRFLHWVFERKKARKSSSAVPAVEPAREAIPALIPLEPERRGAARDVHSFEQRRRGGPLTGEAPPKAHGPRHGGGGQRRGRGGSEASRGRSPRPKPSRDTARRPAEFEDAAFPELPVLDYDELSVAEIEQRVEQLARPDVRRLLAYETANKHRKRVVEVLERRLAA